MDTWTQIAHVQFLGAKTEFDQVELGFRTLAFNNILNLNNMQLLICLLVMYLSTDKKDS